MKKKNLELLDACYTALQHDREYHYATPAFLLEALKLALGPEGATPWGQAMRQAGRIEREGLRYGK